MGWAYKTLRLFAQINLRKFIVRVEVSLIIVC